MKAINPETGVIFEVKDFKNRKTFTGRLLFVPENSKFLQIKKRKTYRLLSKKEHLLIINWEDVEKIINLIQTI